MQDNQPTFRRGSVVFLLPLLMAMMQPGMQKFALSTLSMSAGDVICAGTKCQVHLRANGFALNDLLAGASQISSMTRNFAAEPWIHLRALLCELTRGTLHLAYVLISGLSGASIPTHLDLKLLAHVHPHGNRASECPVAPASRPASDQGAG